MKKKIVIIFAILITMMELLSCNSKNKLTDSANINEITIDTKSEKKITKDMAYKGIDNYCHSEYDWSAAVDNPSIMSVEMGKETDTEYQVIFRSYTGSYTYFYVNKSDGNTRIVEYVPVLDIKEESGTISLFDYLKNW